VSTVVLGVGAALALGVGYLIGKEEVSRRTLADE
jgi:hypothetical protein